jgi:hypothetical protein
VNTRPRQEAVDEGPGGVRELSQDPRRRTHLGVGRTLLGGLRGRLSDVFDNEDGDVVVDRLPADEDVVE